MKQRIDNSDRTGPEDKGRGRVLRIPLRDRALHPRIGEGREDPEGGQSIDSSDKAGPEDKGRGRVRRIPLRDRALHPRIGEVVQDLELEERRSRSSRIVFPPDRQEGEVLRTFHLHRFHHPRIGEGREDPEVEVSRFDIGSCRKLAPRDIAGLRVRYIPPEDRRGRRRISLLYKYGCNRHSSLDSRRRILLLLRSRDCHR